MDRYRSAHTPMDYEFTNGTGPIDESSPFITASRNVSAQNKKRNHSLFDTPTKSTPSLRPPASQPFYFSQSPSTFANNNNNHHHNNNNNNNNNIGRSSPTKPLSSIPEHIQRDPKFSTPRKPSTDFNFSSPETPGGDIDADNADSDATPDSSFMGFKSRAVNFMAGGKNKDNGSPQKSPTKETKEPKERRRDSWIGGLAKALSPGKETTGLGKVPYSDKAEKRIIRRRQKESTGRRKGTGRSRRDGDSDEEDKRKDGSGRTASSVIGAILSYIDSHPNLPHTLSYYAQLVLNFFFVGCIIWIVYSFWSAIQSDVNIEADRAIAEALAEMAVCARDYRENRCDPATRVPAMAQLCDNWHACMNRDPKKVGRARVSAHTFATIFNSFIEPISWKAMFFCLIIVIVCLFVNNVAFTKFRNTHPVHHQQQGHGDPSQQYQQWQQQQAQQWGVPPTPQRYPSGNGWDTPGLPHQMIGGFYQTPAHHSMQQLGGFEPRPSQTPGTHQRQQQHLDGSVSPVKRLQF